MSKKRDKAIQKLRRQLDRMRVAFALADDHVEELQTLHDEDVAAIEHPKPGKVTKKQAKKEIKRRPSYTRG